MNKLLLLPKKDDNLPKKIIRSKFLFTSFLKYRQMNKGYSDLFEKFNQQFNGENGTVGWRIKSELKGSCFKSHQFVQLGFRAQLH